jgi:aryl-alcohol dehydrogenase-like predicted oxidoreductase
MVEFGRTRPIDVVQAPYGMLRRQIEADVLPYCAEQGIGLFVYAPLAYGMLTGTFEADQSFQPGDWRGESSEYRGETFRKNLEVVERLKMFAAEREYSVSQLAIAWSLSRREVDAAIVGTRSAKHIGDAIHAAKIELSVAELEAIDDILRDAVSVIGPTPESLN